MSLRIVSAQINFLLGDIEGNADHIIRLARDTSVTDSADLIVFPELGLTGYPPEDLLFRPDLHQRIGRALQRICEQVRGIDILLGYPELTPEGIYNAALVIRDGNLLINYRKMRLPNYSVFDEKRYFKPGDQAAVFDIKGTRIGIMICEDLWHKEPAELAAKDHADLLIALNASPFDLHKCHDRIMVAQKRVADHGLPLLYVHWIGGQDEVVFDGGSFFMNSNGDIQAHAGFFEEKLMMTELDEQQQLVSSPLISNGSIKESEITDHQRLYQAICLGVKDYVKKNGFDQVFVGLSGGIDSALTLAIAADCLGPENVTAVFMPSRYTAAISGKDAKALAENLSVRYFELSIESPFTSFLSLLNTVGPIDDIPQQNIQSRLRGVILMALANQSNGLVLTTSNKSETAVGYSTLYGDMAGAFCVLKDLYKTQVYELANYRNQTALVIPQRIIDRPPTAELRSDQTDQDHLPPYDQLDHILERYIEHDESAQTIAKEGFDIDEVKHMIALVDINEYKRRQAPPGVKLSTRAFGRDRRYPITSSYHKGSTWPEPLPTLKEILND